MTVIKHDEHVFVTSITGGGKSYFCRNYLAPRSYVLKLDTKGEALIDLRDGRNPWPEVNPGNLVIITDYKLLKEHDWKRKPKVIYVPDIDELEDKAFFEDIFKWAFHKFKDPKKPFVFWVDELKDICPTPYYMPKWMRAMYSKGRFFNSTIWACSQEPKNMPSMCFSQSTHLIAFDLPDISHRKKLAESSGTPDFLKPLDKYQFWYFKRGWRNAAKGIIK